MTPMPQNPPLPQQGMPPQGNPQIPPMPVQGGFQPHPPQGDATQQPEPTQTPLGALVESVNIAEQLSSEDLLKIGFEARRGFDMDCQSRQDWEKAADEYTKLAKQVVEPKTFPWPKASNVKYPLLSTAAMQFAARAYPTLIPSDGAVVKARVIGKDPDGSKTTVADAVSTYMSYQLLEEMEGWEEDMDKLLIMLPIVGVMFKKTYWDATKKVNCSRLVLPKNLVVNYWAKSLCEAERISEVMEINPRILKERQQSGLWLDDIELGPPSMTESEDYAANVPSESDDTTPYVFIEQHTYLDLDKDGYKEPYIVTFHKNTSKVFRIVPRYDEKTIYFTDKGKLARIEPIQYYTKFGFVPNPDGSFYDIGFGVLLGPINESVNTLINQLVDSGTINNLQGGFIGKGLRLRMGETKFNPGEWKVVNSTGDDLKKQIVPLPSKEPSATLFHLLETLITSGKELASVAEIFVGKMPGQNTPATTTMASIDQGMKVFTAVYKRIYRSLDEEFQKLYRLNNLYLNPKTYVDVVQMEVGPDDFDSGNHKIYPGADPSAASKQDKLLKAQGLMEMMQVFGGLMDPIQVASRMLDAQEQPNWKQLFSQQVQQTGQPPPPPPDPKVQALQMKTQADQAAAQQDMQNKQQSAALDQQGKQTDIAAKAAQAQIATAEAAQLSKLKVASQVNADNARMFKAAEQHQQDLAHAAQQHQQTMQQAHDTHVQKIHNMKTEAAAKPAPKGPAKK